MALKSASFPDEVEAGGDLCVHIEIENVGFASLYKERGVALILRNSDRLIRNKYACE